MTDMLDPKLRTAIDVAQTALEALFPDRTFEVNEDYGGGGTAVVFSEGDDHTISVELSPKRKYVHYQATIEEHMDGIEGGIFRSANGVVEKDNLPGDLDLLADSMGLFESMNTDIENTMTELRRQSGKKGKKKSKKSKKRASKQKDTGLKITVMYGGKSTDLLPGSDLYDEYVDWFLKTGMKTSKKTSKKEIKVDKIHDFLGDITDMIIEMDLGDVKLEYDHEWDMDSGEETIMFTESSDSDNYFALARTSSRAKTVKVKMTCNGSEQSFRTGKLTDRESMLSAEENIMEAFMNWAMDVRDS